ncbi:MAG TPA: hypothetical protein VEI45_20270 [Mycobacterium sp.]|uniref:hypothetical protein n=1 Tax=Mycobacterium sp. TaxID=1785 RepID=UPI002D600854|nr:hypothetical protein [Mycobacterium sp.]HXY66633.1 hypothetical protein [Mycobacterium sp.]
MSPSHQPQIRTRMFARVLGPFLVIACITAAARASEMRALLSDFTANALWSWVAGSFVLLGGLVVIALHSYWRSPAAIVVSILGWLVALRGFLLLAFPAAFVSMANSVIGMGGLWRAICIVLAVIGLYLTYVGWMPASHHSTSQAASATADLPRTA